MRATLTVGIWIVSLVSLTTAGLIAVTFGLMATSLDPTEMITAGIEPWTDALWAALAFLGLAAVTVLSLALWHTERFKALSLILTAAEVGCVGWACAKVYAEYF